MHFPRQFISIPAVKLVKHQINGQERVVLKENASRDDLRAEASRLHQLLGYQIEPDEHANRYLATHRFFRGRFVLTLEAD